MFSSTQVRLLERRLGEVAWTPTEQSERADEFQQTLFEKEKVIKNLEGEVESQVRIFQRMKNILVSIFCFTKLLYVLNRSFIDCLSIIDILSFYQCNDHLIELLNTNI